MHQATICLKSGNLAKVVFYLGFLPFSIPRFLGRYCFHFFEVAIRSGFWFSELLQTLFRTRIAKMSLRLAAVNLVRLSCRRNLTLAAVAMPPKLATDPIQQLFVEKVREYATKKKASGGKLVSFLPGSLQGRSRAFRTSLWTKWLGSVRLG